ncbi:hypothetical protein BGZ58_004934 [Dissophora ornata]|nr:hypothetical protein BGZ58_004934 [Dissophora ornata]
MHHALELEEVRTAIGQFLSPSAIIACASCCKEWYESFIPLIWQSLILRNGAFPLPELGTLMKNKDRIKHLTISSCDAWEHMELKECRHLTRLTLTGFYHRTMHYDNWRMLVENHQATLEHLTISPTASIIALSPEFGRAIALCKRLQTLTLQGPVVQALQAAAAFWSACLTIDKLHVKYTTLPIWNDTIVGTARLTHLVVEGPMRGGDGLDLLLHCPKLQSLYWRSSEHITFPLKGFGAAMVAGSWPELEELDLMGYEFGDLDLAAALEGMNRLTRLRAQSTGFGPRSMEALGKNASKIKTLDLVDCVDVTSSMIQTILSSMPQLTELSVGRIRYMDIVNGSPWVALNLEKLHFNIDMEPVVTLESKEEHEPFPNSPFDTHQRLVFERLATLTRLRVLNLIPSSSYRNPYLYRTLQLQLDAGLGALSTLARLEFFGFKSNHQKMGPEEIQWIIKTWPRLRKFRGQFSTDPEYFYSAKKLMNTHHILVLD